VIAIKAIAAYVPESRLDNQGHSGEFGMDEAFLRDKLGVNFVSRRSATEDTADLCEKAFQSLIADHDIDKDSIDCAVVCTQNPDGSGLPHTSAILHGRLNLGPQCACWDISLGCTGYVHGISIVQAFMSAQRLRNGLFFTADPYSKIIDVNDRNTAPIFGDGATVTLLTSNDTNGLFTQAATRFFTDGARGPALQNKSGTLHMDGRAVFNFSATVVPRQIKELLEETGLGHDRIDLYLLHQGSKYIVDTIRQRIAVDASRVPLKLAEQGNLVSSSIPFMLKDYLPRADLRHIVVSGFGVGLSAASAILSRV
jgi:3-oxoacyl-[acyl-carrier-protein] synthase-3